ncbi:MAG: hypothetical protein AAB574_03070 [Patescibacteria group bacterium]
MKKIAWVLRIPEGAEVVIKDGRGVDEGEVIYEFRQGNVVRLSLMGWKNLGVKERGEIIKKISGRNLVKGELLWSGSWIKPRQLRSPLGGKCLGIDELGNIMLLGGSEGKYWSPISCPKVRVEKGRIVFELKGWEKEAEGISQVKGWGEFKGVWVTNLSEVPTDIQNQIIIAEGDEAIVVKAEALGVKGIILVDIEVDTDWKGAGVAMVKMEKKEAEDIIRLSKGSEKTRVWLNPISGKVLLVLE